ncbi:unnamed protein product [Lactuca saligna]|uniref:Peptidase M3A/M3B catalytic domain-containing protein n=1 Tax=Lactuca saligna TaxID=75948 RepID=A0AA36ENZ6_LACSI|nr:unnamed protein product [Lactuca saligna]
MVETVFHEFGHAFLQHTLKRQDEGLVAGIRGIEWDAVELPFQFMENWCYRRNEVRVADENFPNLGCENERNPCLANKTNYIIIIYFLPFLIRQNSTMTFDGMSQGYKVLKL